MIDGEMGCGANVLIFPSCLMGMSEPVHLHRESEVEEIVHRTATAVINAQEPEVQTARGVVATSEVHAKLEPVARQTFRDGVQATHWTA